MAPELHFLAPTVRSLNGELRVQLDWAPGAPDECRSRARELVLAFCKLGAAGGFPSIGFGPGDSTLHFIREMASSSDEQVFLATAANVHADALLVLRNVLVSTSARRWHIDRVTAALSGQADASLQELLPPDHDDYAESYPPESDLCDLDVVEEDPLDYSKSRRCLIEFADELSAAAASAAFEELHAWVTLMEAGGFSPPVRPPERAMVSLNDLQRFDSHTIELTFSVFDASEESWSTLINLLDRLSRKSEVKTVTIE